MKKASVRSTRVLSLVPSLFAVLAVSQIAFASYAQAQSSLPPKASGTTTLKSEGAPRARKSLKAVVAKKPGITAPTFGDFTLITTLKNTITAGRKYELEEIGGKNFNMKNELFVGLKHKSGWAFQASGAVGQSSFADASQNQRGWKDASVILGHPALYSSDSFSLGGQFRQYIPTTNFSRENNLIRTAYYSFADINLPKRFGISNTFFPNKFSQSNPQPENATYLIIDETEFFHKTSSTITLGVAQQTTVETHYATDTGTVVEIIPYMDITIIPNVLIKPKFYMPTYVRGTIDGMASAVTMAQTQAELYIKMGF